MGAENSRPATTGRQTGITEDMVLRGCAVVQELGGVPFNPVLGVAQCSEEVRLILRAALGQPSHRS